MQKILVAARRRIFLFLRPPLSCRLEKKKYPFADNKRTMASSSSLLGRVFDRKIDVGVMLKANDITLDVSTTRVFFAESSRSLPVVSNTSRPLLSCRVQ